MRKRERRRLAVAIASTVVAIPLLLVEVAPGANASPDSQPAPAAFVGAELDETVEPESLASESAADETELSRSVGTVSGDDLAAPRILGVFSGGDALRAEAEAEAEEIEEAARQAEEERLRIREEQEAAREAARRAEAERIAAEQAAQRAADHAAAQAAAEAAAASAPEESAPSGPSESQWHKLRQCESNNNYQAVSRNRLYYGAYQFYQGTWDNTARNAGRTHLVGVNPAEASPADQDAMAKALYASRGHGPWPHCGVHLR